MLKTLGFRSQGDRRSRKPRGPSAASPLLPDAQRHRLRRESLHPTPRRSQRRLTLFFSSLLELRPERLDGPFHEPLLDGPVGPLFQGVKPGVFEVLFENLFETAREGFVGDGQVELFVETE